MAAIARPSTEEAALFYRWPEAQVAAGTPVTCGMREQVVLSAMGRVLAVLGPGTHALTPAAIPALSLAGGGSKLALDVVFVGAGKVPVRFGGKLPAVRDAATSLTFEPRAFGTVNLKVQDAQKLAAQLQAGTSADDVVGFLKSRLMVKVADALGAGKVSIPDLASPNGAQRIADAVAASSPFAEMGVAIDSFDGFSINVDEDTLHAAMQALKQKKAAAQSPAAAMPAASPARAAPAAPSAAPGKSRCNACGAEVPQGKFCQNCGKPMGKTHCSGCGASLPAGAKFCANCGARA